MALAVRTALVALLVMAIGATSQCAQIPIVPNGTCTTYPATGLCAPYLAGQSIFLGTGFSVPILDSIAAREMNGLETNRGIVSEDCRVAGDAFVCSSVYIGCQVQNGEAIPVPPCRNFCDAFWGKCQVAFDAFFVAAIQTLGDAPEEFAFPHCGPNGTWTQSPQPPDVYGQRYIPGLGTFPAGLVGQLRYPETSVVFKRKDNSLLTVQCKNPATVTKPPLDLSLFVPALTCPALLEEEDGECRIPCPFPVISVEQEDAIGLAFVIPAIIALIFCLFVFADSCFVIMESQGFNDILRKQKKFLLFKNSTTETDDNTGTNTGNNSGSKRRRNALRAATLYSLLGASLGILYFLVGPLITLIRKSEVSCGLNAQKTNLFQLVLGQADRTDGFCRAQRVAPFILQMVFNLILYAIVRVFMVVTERSRRMTKRQHWIFDISLLAYCAGIPILFLIIAASKDELSTNLADFVTQVVRNSAICVMRLSVADEVILIFMPFIITGCLICGLSYYIYTHLSQINQNVQGLMSNNDAKVKPSSSATALRLLMIRLSFLGVSTFIVLLIFISATASLMVAMAQFAPKFNDLFLCQATQATKCQSCEAQQALMLDRLPSAVPFAAQIASMSAITLLFGGFFAAQSAARLYKEYQDGSLKLKFLNLWYGRPANFGNDKLETSFQSFTEPNTSKLAKLPEVMKESCATLFCRRVDRIRRSISAGRARGQVFRWVKGRGQAPPKARMTGFVMANAWTSTPKVDEKNIQWQGIVGVPHSAADPAQWSSSNSNFGKEEPIESPVTSPVSSPVPQNRMRYESSISSPVIQHGHHYDSTAVSQPVNHNAAHYDSSFSSSVPQSSSRYTSTVSNPWPQNGGRGESHAYNSVYQNQNGARHESTVPSIANPQFQSSVQRPLSPQNGAPNQNSAAKPANQNGGRSESKALKPVTPSNLARLESVALKPVSPTNAVRYETPALKPVNSNNTVRAENPALKPVNQNGPRHESAMPKPALPAGPKPVAPNGGMQKQPSVSSATNATSQNVARYQSIAKSPVFAVESRGAYAAPWSTKNPSWGYSENKIGSSSSSTPSTPSTDTPQNSATRREQFVAPPDLPDI